MYHYVRPIKESKFSQIKGLEVAGFQKRIAFFGKKFEIAGIDFLLDSINLQKNENKECVILTFDDGLKDHYNHVFPILKDKGIQGLFFPPAKPIIENIVLDVHKIHFILASVRDKSILVNDVFDKIKECQSKYDIDDPQKLWAKVAIPNRFDSAEIIFLKRVLQRELPLDVRKIITKELFEKYVSSDESDFSKQLYLSFDEIKEMTEYGMYFSSHGYSHEWLSYLSQEILEKELKNSIAFCKKINPDKKQIMCYPYGNFDLRVIKKIRELDFQAGLTTVVGDAELNENNRFKLKRYDTNDFIQ